MSNEETELELPEVTAPDIDRAIQTGIYKKTFSAAACIASVGGRVFHRAVYGSLTQPPPIRKLDHSTLFDLASLTKPLGTGLAALKLASQSRIDLNAPVSKTIPEMKDPKFAGISIDMLLEHTAGFPAFRSYWEDVREQDEGKRDPDKVAGTQKAVAAVRNRVRETVLEAEPGSKVIYSDIGFMVLGWIIEGIVGRPLDLYLARDIYRELGVADDLFFVRPEDTRAMQRLRRRTFAATEECAWRDKLVQGEVHDPNAWIMGGVAGHAGLFGTADAVWRVVHALWQSYKGEGRAFLGGSVRRFWTRSKRLRDTTRTLAWDTPSDLDRSCGRRYSKNAVGHNGFTGTSVWIDLSTDVIGVVLTNAAHPSPEGKRELLAKFRPRVYDLIAKEGESLPEDPERKTGSAAFSSTVAGGVGMPMHNPLRGPGK